MSRRRAVVSVMLGAVLVVAGTPVASAAPPPDIGPHAVETQSGAVPGQVLVAAGPERSLPEVAEALGVSRIVPLPHRPDVGMLEVPAGQEQTVARSAARLAGVGWASSNHIATITAPPDDPGYPRQWNLGVRERAAGAANWQPVYGTGVSGSGVTVAVIDTGVTANPDLDGVVPGYDFVDDDTDPSDEHGHGTHVAGTVAQSTGNGIGVSGVAADATVLAVRALDATGKGTYAHLISAIAFAVDQGADVLNLSFAGSADGGLCDAMARAVAAGTVVVVAAGNSARPVGFPAACPAVIAVSATTIQGIIATYSNRGPEIDLAAPGGDTATDFDGDGAMRSCSTACSTETVSTTTPRVPRWQHHM